MNDGEGTSADSLAAPLALQSPALPSTAPFEFYIHKVVYALGRAFKYQAYNLNPETQGEKTQQEWVPATVFVASDHLSQILAKNMFTRNPSDEDARGRFILSIWELHAKIFQGYFKWCDHVNLPSRPTQQAKWFDSNDPHTDDIAHMLMNELALYYCMWTESANLRYMPELCWFIFWNARFSSKFAALTQGDGKGGVLDVPTDPNQPVPNTRQIREQLRKEHWVPIERLRQEGAEPTPERVTRYTGCSREHVDLLMEIVANGDGGEYLDCVVQPIFHFLAKQMDFLGGKQGMESINRINYDDVNESMTNRSVVSKVMQKLGVSGSKLKDVHEGFESIMKLPITEEGNLDPVQASEFWEYKAFVKTYRERRSYLQIFRTFWRMFAFHILLFHELLIISLYGFKNFPIETCFKKFQDDGTLEGTIENEECQEVSGFIAAHSSVLLTHAFLSMLERFAAGYLTRGVKDPKAKREKKTQKKKKQYVDLENPPEMEELNKKQKKEKKKKKKRASIRVEGAPFGVYLEGIFWLLLFLGMLAIFLFQFLDPEEVQVQGFKKDDFKTYWIILSVGYFSWILLHGILTTRDGFMVSLSSILSFGLLNRYSLRGRPLNEVYTPMKTTWRVFFWNMFFWVVTLSVKACFDYYFIVNPLADALKALSREGWLEEVFSGQKILGTSVTLPDDGDFILMIVRAVPSFLITLVDTSVFYMLMAVFFGMMRGLTLLNLGVVGNFAEVQNEFRRCPKQWWRKCISLEGHRNIGAHLSRERNLLPLGAVDPTPEGEEDTRREKKRKKKKDAKKKRMRRPKDRGGEEMYDVFADTWNQIIDDLREADLISNSEMENLKYMKLDWHPSLYDHRLKPLMQPVFVFAGQLQKAVEVSRPSLSQVAVTKEVRDFLLWLLSQFGMLEKEFCDTMRTVFLLDEPFDRHHRISRRNLLTAVKDFVCALQSLSKVSAKSDEWMSAIDSVRKTIERVLEGLWEELEALRDKKKTKRLKLWPKVMKENIENLDNFIKRMKKEFLIEEGELERCLWPLSVDGPPAEDNGIEEEDFSGGRASHRLLSSVISALVRRMTTTRVVATPSGREARQFMTFFVTSLFNPQLDTPPALANMMSWTTLVPVYQEDVIYAIEAEETAKQVGGTTSNGGTSVTDLLSETDSRVSLLSYLRSVYPKDFQNFLERMKEKYKIDADAAAITGTEFKEGGDLHKMQVDLLLWASHRGQLLARTIRGMMVYEKALKLIALLEHPRPEEMTNEEYEYAVEEVVAAKFRCVVAAQVYGVNRRGKTLKHKWDARAVEILLERNPTLRVSYIDTHKTEGGAVQYSTLIRGLTSAQARDLGEKRSTEEVYRVRLPRNEFTGRGIIIGEGKPENQNHAILFAFGENLQTIDMNQDNFLLEALKMRNLLNELRAPEYIPGNSRKQPKKAKQYQKKLLDRLEKRHIKKPILIGFREWIFSDKAGALGSFAAGTEFAFGTILQRVMTFPGRARFHYGHPDVWDKLWVMTRGGISKASRNLHVSEDVFGGFNAGLRGGKIAYRDYLSVGKGRDMGFVSINGFEIKISGGNGEVCISRELYRLATRMDFFRMMSMYYSGPGFFINNAILMTTVYIQTWVLAVLALAGAYLVEIGPPINVDDDITEAAPLPPGEEPELGRRLLQYNFDDELDSYYDNLNNVEPEAPPTSFTPPDPDLPTILADNLSPTGPIVPGAPAPPFSGQAPAGPAAPGQPVSQAVFLDTGTATGQASNFTTESTVRNVDTAIEVTSIVQLGMLTVIAYVGELLLELGMLQTLAVVLLQVLSGSLAFFIFKQQTDASAFVEDMNYGGARYVGTGREFALMHNPFVTLYVRYARTHFYFAVKLILLCIMLLILDVPGYGPATFGSWMVALSLIFAPFWFNPVQFVMAQTKLDYKQWTRFMQGEEVDPDSRQTWYTWHDKMMAKTRNEQGTITDHWLNRIRAIIFSLLTSGLLSVAAISQVRTNEDLERVEDLETLEKNLTQGLRGLQVPFDEMQKRIQQIEDIREQRLQAEADELGIATTSADEKFKIWGIVTILLAVVAAFAYLLISCFKVRGRTKYSRVVRVLTAFAFIIASIALIRIPNFLRTKDNQNGFRNLLLIYYADLQIIIFVIQVMQHTNQDRVAIRHIVDKAYHILDSFLGVLLFSFLFVLSFTGFFSIIQNTLLYNVSVARSIQGKELVDTIGIERVGKSRDDSEDGDEKPALTERLQRLMDPDREESFTGSKDGGSILSVTREGSFTRGDSFTNKNLSGKFGGSPGQTSQAFSQQSSFGSQPGRSDP